MGHVSFYRDNKVYLLGGVKDIKDRESLEDPNLFYLNIEVLEWFQVYLGTNIPMFCAYLENSEELIFGSGCRNINQVKFWNLRPKRTIMT